MRQWCASRRLQLNADKTEAIWCGSHAYISKLSSQDRTLAIDETTINATDVVRDLGVLLDSELSITQHVASVASVCFYHIRRLRQIRRRVGQEVTTRLVLATVTPDLTIATLSLQVCRIRRWNHRRESKTAQHVSSSVFGIGITSRQLYSNCTGYQSRLECSSSCVHSCTVFTTVSVRRTCLMLCS